MLISIIILEVKYDKQKKFYFICFVFIFVTLLLSCTTNETSIWCKGLNEVDIFSFDYSVIKNTYDGSVRNFNVKDSDKFETYLYSLKEFSTTFEMSDSKEQVFIFKHNGDKYEIVKKK